MRKSPLNSKRRLSKLLYKKRQMQERRDFLRKLLHAMLQDSMRVLLHKSTRAVRVFNIYIENTLKI